MKAVTRTQYGTPDLLSIREMPRPEPQAKELLVHVYATTVNRTDCAILTGTPFPLRFVTGLFRPSSPIPGTDFAGEVITIGQAVTDFQVGDRVWGFNDNGIGSQAEYLTIGQDQAVATLPTDFTYEHAVACAEGAHYAINFINKVHLNSGDRVLVNGATGAIGSAAVQLLKHREIFVTAVGNTKNLELLADLGADKIYNYEREDFTRDTERYHHVFDAVGKSSFGACRHLLRDGGAYLSSELGPGGENLYLPLITKIRGGKRVIFPIPSDCRASIIYLTKLLETGAFKAVIDRTYPVEEIVKAYHYVASGEKTGNVIVRY